MSENGRDEEGRFVHGNRFWRARSSHGRKPKFETADDLDAACEEYFEWVADNPLQTDNLVTFQGAATHASTAQLRAMTLDGLCNFIDVSRKNWDVWRTERPDLSDIITRVESIIRQQKFEGAAAGMLNPTIISRDLGLADKQELTGKNGGPIEVDDATSARQRIAARIARTASAEGTPASD